MFKTRILAAQCLMPANHKSVGLYLEQKPFAALFFALIVAGTSISSSAYAASRHYVGDATIANSPITAERILCINANGKGWKVGTATVLGEKTRLTAYHVIKDCKVVYIKNKAFKVAYSDPSIDLAVLGSGRDFRRLNCQAVRKGQAVSLTGYPAGSKQAVVSQGIKSRDKKSRYAAVEGFAMKGMSGGPVMQSQEQLSGIFQSYRGTSRYWYVPGPKICHSLRALSGAMINFNAPLRPEIPYQPILTAQNQDQIVVQHSPSGVDKPNEHIRLADSSNAMPVVMARQQINIPLAHTAPNTKTNVQAKALAIMPKQGDVGPIKPLSESTSLKMASVKGSETTRRHETGRAPSNAWQGLSTNNSPAGRDKPSEKVDIQQAKEQPQTLVFSQVSPKHVKHVTVKEKIATGEDIKVKAIVPRLKANVKTTSPITVLVSEVKTAEMTKPWDLSSESALESRVSISQAPKWKVAITRSLAFLLGRNIGRQAIKPLTFLMNEPGFPLAVSRSDVKRDSVVDNTGFQIYVENSTDLKALQRFANSKNIKLNLSPPNAVKPTVK